MPRQSRFTPCIFAEWQRLYESGMSTKQIGAMFNIDGGTVYDRLQQMGVTTRSPSEGRRIYHVNNNAFTSVADEPTAYWLGFLFADGCIYRRTDGGNPRLSIALAEADVHHLERFKTFMASDYPIRYDAHRKCVRTEFVSAMLFDDLRRWGCRPNKSLYLHLPRLPFTLMQHFIRGYFDGDGSAYTSGPYKTPNLSFCSNVEFLEGIANCIFAKTNADGNLYKHTTSDVYYLVYRGEHKVQAVARYLYADAKIWLERKYATVMTFPKPKRENYPTRDRYE
jgi:hypothetical protein